MQTLVIMMSIVFSLVHYSSTGSSGTSLSTGTVHSLSVSCAVVVLKICR
ncbi:hypothetical protein ACB098_06G175300 [Castanea mollissima]